MEYYVLWVLGPIGVHSMAPVKWWWLVLMLVASAIQAALVWRLWRAKSHGFPLLTLYLAVMLFYPLRWLPGWRLWMQSGITILSVLATLEALFTTGWMSRNEPERFYARRFCCAIGLSLLFVGFMMRPELHVANALPGPWRNYLPLYSDLACTVTLLVGSGYVLANAVRGRHGRIEALWSHCTILMVWFAAGLWAELPRYLPAEPPWLWFRYENWLLTIRIGCLLAWHVTLITPRPESAHEVSPGSTHPADA